MPLPHHEALSFNMAAISRRTSAMSIGRSCRTSILRLMPRLRQYKVKEWRKMKVKARHRLKPWKSKRGN